jgi:hypothetical protein
MKFDRTSSSKLIQKLLKEKLYKEELKNDKDIFMAFRKSEIDFYYKGSRIYKYTSKGFMSHKKYSLNTSVKDDIVLEDLAKGKVDIISDLLTNHKHIKINGKEKAKKEDKGISNLYKYDYFSNNDIFLLDVEIALYDDKSKDRIDILLYDNKNATLKFIEAKDYSNKELWAIKGSKPKVIEQINRYSKRLEDKKIYDLVLSEYVKYIKILKTNFNLDINIPKKIEKKVSLYMFGFDQNQKNKIFKLLKDDNSLEDIPYYFLGDASKINVAKLFNADHNAKS